MTKVTESAGPRAGLWNKLSKIFASRDELDADDEQRAVRREGCSAISSAASRTRVTVSGVISAITVVPHDSAVRLEADLWDGSGSLVLVWIGRREIPGIEAGRRLIVTGLIAEIDGRRIMYNPNYRLAA